MTVSYKKLKAYLNIEYIYYFKYGSMNISLEEFIIKFNNYDKLELLG
jgi:hypothetical protein